MNQKEKTNKKNPSEFAAPVNALTGVSSLEGDLKHHDFYAIIFLPFLKQTHYYGTQAFVPGSRCKLALWEEPSSRLREGKEASGRSQNEAEKGARWLVDAIRRGVPIGARIKGQTRHS